MTNKAPEELKTEELDQVVGGKKSQKQGDGIIDIVLEGHTPKDENKVSGPNGGRNITGGILTDSEI